MIYINNICDVLLHLIINMLKNKCLLHHIFFPRACILPSRREHLICTLSGVIDSQCMHLIKPTEIAT
jgi:hypothetical protein